MPAQCRVLVRAVPAPRWALNLSIPTGNTAQFVQQLGCSSGKRRKAGFLGMGWSSANLSLYWRSVSAPSRVLSPGPVFLLSLLLLYCVWKPKERQLGLCPILTVKSMRLSTQWRQGASQYVIRAWQTAKHVRQSSTVLLTSGSVCWCSSRCCCCEKEKMNLNIVCMLNVYFFPLTPIAGRP